MCKGHARSVEGLSVSPNGTRFASVSWDKMLKVWSLTGSEAEEEDQEGHSKRRRLQGKATTRVRPGLLPLKQGCIRTHRQSLPSRPLHESQSKAIVLGWALANDSGMPCHCCLRLLHPPFTLPSPSLQTPHVTLSGHTQPVTGVVWPSAGEVVTCGWDHCIRLWDIEACSNKSSLVRV